MNWDDLQALRDDGQRPVQLVVTTNWQFCNDLPDGAMVILHRKGDAFPIELLHGLDVELRFDDCSQATAVGRLLRAREVQPSRMHVWCRCERASGPLWSPNCKIGEEIREVWEAMCNRAA